MSPDYQKKKGNIHIEHGIGVNILERHFSSVNIRLGAGEPKRDLKTVTAEEARKVWSFDAFK